MGCLGIVVGIPLLVGGVIWLMMRVGGGGKTFARMALSETPAETTFSLDAKTTVQVWANVDIRHKGVNPETPTDELPHLVDYVMDFRGPNAARVALRCNPFHSNVARASGTYNTPSEGEGRNYDGLIEGCNLELPKGAYSVRAHLEPVGTPDARFHFDTTELVLRAR